MTTWTYRAATSSGTITTTAVVNLSGKAVTTNYYQGSTDYILNSTTIVNSISSYSSVIEANGTNWNIGSISFGPSVHYGMALLTIGKGVGAPNLINYGKISFSSTTQGEIAASARGAVITNNGDISGNNIRIDPSIIGNGTISFVEVNRLFYPNATATIELVSDIGSGQTVDMSKDGTLVIDDLHDFHATVKGFTAITTPQDIYSKPTQDIFDVRQNITSTTYSGNTNHGTLNLYAGRTLAGSIALTGDFTHSRFTVTHSGSDSLIGLA